MAEYNPILLMLGIFSFMLLVLFFHLAFSSDKCSFLNCNENIRPSSVDKITFNQELLQSAIEVVFPRESILKMQIMFPTALWISESKEFLVIVRVFINERKSFLYGSLFDKDWKQITIASQFQSLNLPGPVEIEVPDYKLKYSGPEDARLFQIESGEIYCIFNMIDEDKKRKMHLLALKDLRVQKLFLTNYYESSTPSIGPPSIPAAEKNWAPLIDHNSMNFVYNFAEFQVAKCKSLANCSLVHGAFDKTLGLIKGGTPFVRFQKSSNYFFGLTYTHFHHSKLPFKCIIYRPTLTVLYKGSGSGEFQYVYASDPLELRRKPFSLAFPGERLEICNNFRIMIACSIAQWNYEEDEAVVTLNINDEVPIVTVLRGIRPMVEAIIHYSTNQILAFNSKCPDRLAVRHFKL